MMPKILHFIWFPYVDGTPNWVCRSVDAFARMNPGFEIDFVRGIGEREKPLLDQIDSDSGEFAETIKRYRRIGRPRMQILSDILRLKLLNEQGGIYLDCDCMPLRPFDDAFVDRGSACVRRMYPSGHFGPDCYFMASDGTFRLTSYEDFPESSYIDDIDSVHGISLAEKAAFVRCAEYSPKPQAGQYVRHYGVGHWRRNDRNMP